LSVHSIYLNYSSFPNSVGRSGCSDVRIRVRDVAEHAQVQQRVAEPKHGTSDNGGPERGFAVGRESKPE
jgi:hypothetical protein